MNIFYMTGCTFVSKKIPNRSKLINFTKNRNRWLFLLFHRGEGLVCVVWTDDAVRFSSFFDFELRAKKKFKFKII